MIETTSSIFGRVITAMVTPFNDELNIDFPAVDRLVKHLIETGTDTLVVCGTTGENPTLESEEKVDLLKAVIKAANGKAKIIMGTGSNSTRRTIDASKQAQDLGADGLLIVAPYYNKPNQAGLIAHFDAVLQTINLPVILYNIPGRTGINIANDTIVNLSKSHSHLQGLKDSTGNVEQAGELAGELAGKLNSNFRLYSGDDYLTLPFLSIGASGVISVASHVAGKQTKAMIDNFFAGELDRARSLHYELLPLFKGLFLAPNPSCVKYMLAKQGIIKGNMRLPLVPVDAEIKAKLDLLSNELLQTAKVS